MTEIVVQASPAAGLGAGLSTRIAPEVFGPVIVGILGLVMLAWLVRQLFVKQVPLDVAPPEPRAAGDQIVRERFHPRASDLLPRPSRYL